MKQIFYIFISMFSYSGSACGVMVIAVHRKWTQLPELKSFNRAIGYFNKHGTNVTANSSSNNNVVFFFVSDLKIVYNNNY